MDVYRHDGCVYLDDGVTCLMRKGADIVLTGHSPVRGFVLYEHGSLECWRDVARDYKEKSVEERKAWLDELLCELERTDFDEGLMPNEEEWMQTLEWRSKEAGFDPYDVQQLMGYQAAIDETAKLSFGDSDVRAWFDIVQRHGDRSDELLGIMADLRQVIPSWFVRNFLI